MDDICARFERDGFIHVPNVLSQEQVDVLDARVRDLYDSSHVRSRQVLYVDGQVPVGTPPLDRLLHQWLNPHRYDDGLGTRDLVEAPRAIADRLLDASSVLFQDLLLLKEPGQQRFPWHQDFPFWPIDRPRGVVCWIPLIRSDDASGGLQCARGSHRIGAHGAVDLHCGVPQNTDSEMPDVEAMFPVCTPPVEAGSALFFSPLLFHSSPPKTTPGHRVAWSSAWLHPQVCWRHARAPAHPLCKRTRDGARVSTIA